MLMFCWFYCLFGFGSLLYLLVCFDLMNMFAVSVVVDLFRIAVVCLVLWIVLGGAVAEFDCGVSLIVL